MKNYTHIKFPRIKPEKDLRRKLMPNDILKMQLIKKSGKYSLKTIAKMFGVSTALVCYHCLGENYKKKWNRKIIDRVKKNGYYGDYKEIGRKSKERRRQEKEFREYSNEITKKWYYQDDEHRKLWIKKAMDWKKKHTQKTHSPLPPI
jgi:ribosomal protein L33